MTKQPVFGNELTLADFIVVVTDTEKTYTRINSDTQNTYFQESEGALVYGFNTGFGPMADVFIGPVDQISLQYNLIRSHAAGLGDIISATDSRAILAARLQTLSLGYSAVSNEVLEMLLMLLNSNISPVIPEHGSVGASGDLVQLAHAALCVLGEGQVWSAQTIREATDVFAEKAITPANLSGRDGLALINGTAAMTGIAARNTHQAQQLVDIAVKHTAILYELLNVHHSVFDEIVGAVRPHSGQQAIIAQLNQLLIDSRYVQKAPPSKPAAATVTTAMETNPQEFYSLRCVPQILGPIHEATVRAERTVTVELNSVTDNPIFTNDGHIHNGNFHGDFISYEMDCLKIAVAKLSLLAERQLHQLLHPRLHSKLPPFLNRGIPGVTLGLQGMQFTATSTVAENQALTTPLSTHSIPTNGDNQDIVSMGTNSALLCRKVIENTYQVLAIQAVSLVQATRLLKRTNRVSTPLYEYLAPLFEIVPDTTEDIVWHTTQKQMVEKLKNIHM